jgi:hypothetical protein
MVTHRSTVPATGETRETHEVLRLAAMECLYSPDAYLVGYTAALAPLTTARHPHDTLPSGPPGVDVESLTHEEAATHQYAWLALDRPRRDGLVALTDEVGVHRRVDTQAEVPDHANQSPRGGLFGRSDQEGSVGRLGATCEGDGHCHCHGPVRLATLKTSGSDPPHGSGGNLQEILSHLGRRAPRGRPQYCTVGRGTQAGQLPPVDADFDCPQRPAPTRRR